MNKYIIINMNGYCHSEFMTTVDICSPQLSDGDSMFKLSENASGFAGKTLTNNIWYDENEDEWIPPCEYTLII